MRTQFPAPFFFCDSKCSQCVRPITFPQVPQDPLCKDRSIDNKEQIPDIKSEWKQDKMQQGGPTEQGRSTGDCELD